MRYWFAQSSRSGTEVAVVMIDLDGFKAVNDTYGHDLGDQLLVLTSKVLRARCREGDLVARMGGDEFILLLPRTGIDAACVRADQIRRDFEREAQTILSDNGPRVTMSLGVACNSQTRPSTSAKLITQADHALYRAKSAGKSCVVPFRPPIHDNDA